MKRWFGSLELLFVAAAATTAVAEPSPSPLARAIDRIVERPAFASAFWGLEIRNARTGKVLYARNAGKNMKPASTLKLVTTAAVLDALGPDARLRTSVETAGRLDGLGRILGDVFLVGRGDPGLSARSNEGRAVFEELSDGLWAAGVRRIEGRLVGHEGLFKGERRGEDWAWEDLVWGYGAEVSALSFNDNCADIRLGPGERPGDPAVVESSPPSSYYSVLSSVTTSPAGTPSSLALARDFGSNVIRLSGTVPIGEPAWERSVALEDPARYAATVFAQALESRGIRLVGPVITSSEPLPAAVRALVTHDSAPMLELLTGVNKPSQNLHAEMLLRLLGAYTKGEGSAAAGHAAAREFLKRVGVAAEAWSLRDGSGLSRSDLLSPHELVSLLVAMARHPHATGFRATLPVAGVDGTLKARMKGSAAEGRIEAKTGSIRHANALAGYATPRGGDRLVFAIVVNHHTLPAREAVAAIDEIVNVLVGK